MSSVDTILQQVDMECTRAPSALCEWVVSKASALSETDEGKRFARSGATLPKKLWEEIRPLGLFAFHRYGLGSDVKCTPNLNNESYDGRIDFDDISVPSIYVEITYAKDGYDESLRLEVLSASGSVNRSGRISISGTKASGHRKVDVENEFVDREETRVHALEIVRERIINKSDKVYGSNHILVVVIDDYLPFRTEDDRMILVEYAKSIIDNVKLDFGEIALLGSSGNYLCTI
jgi:hypothetical protein